MAQTWPVRGGSNFIWYSSSPKPCYLGGTHKALPAASHTPDAVDPFYVITNYDLHRTEINAALDALYAAGQRRLRLMILHRRDGERAEHPGPRMTNMDSNGGNLSPQCLRNLTDYLAAVKSKGFIEVAVTFAPVGYNYPQFVWGDWTPWPAMWFFKQPWEGYYQENWNLIVNLRPILAAAGLNIKLDLMNEAIPPPGMFPGLFDYCRRLWSDYTSCFGKSDTFGFSLCNPYQFLNMPNVYGNNPPFLFDVHIYTTMPDLDLGGDVSSDAARAEYLKMWNGLADAGYTSQGWIIGECWGNSPGCASGFAAAQREAGNTVYWLTQWAADSHYQYSNPPADYAYLAEGW